MYLKVPEVNNCCFCCPLRWGIFFFAYINIVLSVSAAVCMVVSTELQQSTSTDHTSIEVVMATMLFAVFGMGVILNILLLVAGYQKDAAMLRLYISYAMATVVAAMIPTGILIFKLRFIEGVAAVFAIAMQCYVIVLVRSEIVKLKQMKFKIQDHDSTIVEGVVDVPDSDRLVS